MPGPAFDPMRQDPSISSIHGPKPHVHLPTPAHMESNHYAFHPQQPIPPMSGTFDDSVSNEPADKPVVSLPPYQPIVSLPPNHASLGRNNPTGRQMEPNPSFENQMRGLILQNDPPEMNPGHSSQRFTNNATQNHHSSQSQAPSTPNSASRSSNRRPNQAQRRGQNVQFQQDLNTNGKQKAGATDTQGAPHHIRQNQGQWQVDSRSQYGSNQPSGLVTPAPALVAHSRGQHSNSQQIRADYSHVPPPRFPQNPPGRSNGPGPRNQEFPAPHFPNRPEPSSRRLYNPGMGNRAPTRFGSHQQQTYVPTESFQDQAEYLDSIAMNEVPRAEISAEEYDRKQALRLSLEKVCRLAVSGFEMNGNPDFVADSVELKCFGSLATTFGTRDSDMDLLLISPDSKPEVTDPESELPRLIEKALLDLGYGARLLTNTRVSIIKFCEQPGSDLGDLLRQERLKWEKVEGKKTKDEKVKEQKAKEEKAKEGKVNDKKAKEKTVKEEKAKGMPSCSEKPKGTKKKKNSRLDIGNLQTPQAHSSILPVTPDAPNFDGTQDLSIESNDALENDPIDIVDPKVQPSNPSQSSKPNANGDERDNPGDKEDDDPSLLLKSDEERVRLYQLAMKEEWYTNAERNLIFKFIRVFFEKHSDSKVLDAARNNLRTLPNVLRRYRAPPEKHLDFPKSGVGIQCDINFSNHLALHNSTLLRCYSLCDPRVRRMVLFVKAWSKKRKINSPYHGTLSSYGYVLMVLHYLVNIAQPAVLRDLQHFPLIQQDELSLEQPTLDGYNILFFRNEAVIRDLAARGQLTQNRESVGSLLRGFFEYFGLSTGYGHFHWMQEVLSLRTPGGILLKQGKGWVEARTETVNAAGPKSTKEVRQRYLLSIEDPFETHHNVGRTVVHNGIVAIRDEFRRAHNMIKTAGLQSAGQEPLFAEAEGKENLQYRAFGPRPRKNDGQSRNGSNNSKPEASTNSQKLEGKLTQSTGDSNNPTTEKNKGVIDPPKMLP